MRSIATSLTLLASITLNAQCDEPFFSEVVEGTGGVMALEIYNPRSTPLNLNYDYYVRRFPDGSPVTQGYVALGFTIAAHGTLVLQAADLIAADVEFDGDDAFDLEYIPGGGSPAIVDFFGQAGVDPGTGWTDDAGASFTDANGATPWTTDHTLVRKPTVQAGYATVPNPFNVTLQWDSLPVNTTSGLGAHVCDCLTTGINDAVEAGLSVVSIGDVLWQFDAPGPIAHVSVVDASGRICMDRPITGANDHVTIPAVPLGPGIFVARATLQDGRSFSVRFCAP